ncbi:Putative transmembrane protein (PGPGW) [Colwellia chukchiensis]|uniref:Putative transmembrane protein (PGPGW) n=1 Tax=Colwellia chukchiensis TaxID=641665 RepID=A0A1H7L9A6_9GAMM|nr:PGPGW domain-containing protein [Colwellia chukchiensis]SEK94857.1 Putative transmembrane protein (PGPGW) [Colwellia chukchiensis]
MKLLAGKKFKRLIVSVVGGILLLLGMIFILLPGPAVIFIPLGLALLSLEYDWAKIWLRKCQSYFRAAAVKADQSLYWLRKKLTR